MLSPYISRGVISTKQIVNYILSLNIGWYKTEKIIQELAWRDYWQLIWVNKKNQIFTDLKNPQQNIENHKIPDAIINAETKINAVDEAIKVLYSTGYMHNHMRMYVASVCCNIAKCHWLTPAKWLYSNLYDGDIASNHLSWQWVSGTFSNKKYYANQSNINKYFNSGQKGTFLDVEYPDFYSMATPDTLKPVSDLKTNCILPCLNDPEIRNIKTLVFNYYNLDPEWHKNEDFQKVLLLEPSFFEKFPINQNCLDFAISLSVNLKNIKLFVGEFQELAQIISFENLFYKEHPTNKHYKGNEENRDWICEQKGYYPSFFSFWKKCKKELKAKINENET